MRLTWKLPPIVAVLRQELNEELREAASKRDHFRVRGNQLPGWLPSLQYVLHCDRPPSGVSITMLPFVPTLGLFEMQIFGWLSPSRKNHLVSRARQIIGDFIG